MLKARVGLALLATVATGALGATAAGAQNQSGLVNVAVVNNTVQIPIGIAANVCGVTVNLLATATTTSPVDCTAVAGATATSTGNPGGGGGGNQSGLVNIYIADNTIQVPVGIAANICGVAANILAQGTSSGPATCNATGNGTAG
jgi:hypothetical protein